jgi:hypothetical protein
MENSKFYVKTPIKERLVNSIKGLLFWKGRKKGIVHTRDIEWDDIRAVFFPKNFYEKHKYLGAVPWNEKGSIFKAMEPLVVFMDYKAKPWWCPRWFLRFLHLFGSDNSIVRVRNRTLHNLQKKITKGYMLWDYKTKWYDYDLRISVAGSEQMHELVRAIEERFFNQGYKEDLVEQIKKLDPKTKHNTGYLSEDLRIELDRLRGFE